MNSKIFVQKFIFVTLLLVPISSGYTDVGTNNGSIISKYNRNEDGFSWRTFLPTGTTNLIQMLTGDKVDGVGSILQALIGDKIDGVENILQTVADDKTELTGSLSDIKIRILQILSSLKLNPFTIWNIFINTLRTSLPILAPIGNYTLLQLALCLAIGGLATGVAIIVAETVYFKKLHDEEDFVNHHRRDYEIRHGIYKVPKVSNKDDNKGKNHRKLSSNNRPLPTTNPVSPNRYKPQSLRRTQRRNQRKNKNAGEQLEYYKKMKTKSNVHHKRKRRQLWNNLTYPTVAPRPYFFQHNNNINQWITSSKPYNYQPHRSQNLPNILIPHPTTKTDDIFSLKFISNFIHRHSSGLMNLMPNIPGLSRFYNNIGSSSSSSSTYTTYPPYSYHSQKQRQDQELQSRQEFVPQPLNSKKNMISRTFQRYKKNR